MWTVACGGVVEMGVAFVDCVECGLKHVLITVTVRVLSRPREPRPLHALGSVHAPAGGAGAPGITSVWGAGSTGRARLLGATVDTLFILFSNRLSLSRGARASTLWQGARFIENVYLGYRGSSPAHTCTPQSARRHPCWRIPLQNVPGGATTMPRQRQAERPADCGQPPPTSSPPPGPLTLGAGR